ncbi:alpha-L-Rha alpha-1,3-L-rhamnosyltransferase [Vagococcus entomophilus]|uniref:Alpha-L-Rha alpha-1,3-L-rhamnosyltransferase n=2 Tax=Vagococcus entomophilus TaxID=1160095 RepID=A0A430AIS1_9ENTE|nr:alpha-L-Rha alpha-1,3-L-rhamnosyltransferase [Vagococcus entomophilus]
MGVEVVLTKRISVCMATYNGEDYVDQQIKSILPQLSKGDELIISDDGSSDATLRIIKRIQQVEPGIKLIKNVGSGVIQNFETAIKYAQNELIFLADQDDIWHPEKVEIMKNYFEDYPDKQVLMSDLIVMDASGNEIMPSYYQFRKCKTGFLKNLFRSSYIGCAMVFRSEFKKEILPIPKTVPMHDMWIGLLADKKHQVLMIPEKLVFYRRHEKNVSEIKTKASFWQQIKWRVTITYLLIKRMHVKY